MCAAKESSSEVEMVWGPPVVTGEAGSVSCSMETGVGRMGSDIRGS